MVTDAVLGGLFSIVGRLVTALPTSSGWDVSWLGTLFSYVRGFDGHLPIHELLALGAVLFAVIVVMNTFGLAVWLYHQLPFVG
jgi:hypothetical protein